MRVDGRPGERVSTGVNGCEVGGPWRIITLDGAAMKEKPAHVRQEDWDSVGSPLLSDEELAAMRTSKTNPERIHERLRKVSPAAEVTANLSSELAAEILNDDTPEWFEAEFLAPTKFKKSAEEMQPVLKKK
jgi:hypothetical protein